MNKTDVTKHVSFDNPDDESLPFRQCVCGQEWEAWEMQISIYSDTPTRCGNCGRKFYFSQSITVWEVIDNP